MLHLRLDKARELLAGTAGRGRVAGRRLLVSGVWRNTCSLKDFVITRYRGVVNGINFDKVYEDLANDQRTSLTYIAMTIVSANIATLGLLMNNAPVIIGAMIISPLMGPIMGGGLSFALGDYALGKKAVKTVLLGIILSLVFSALITVLSPMKTVTSEILARTAPTILDMIIAIFCGAAAALSVLFDSISGSIVGVAISVALMPPLCVVGIGIGMGKIGIAVGSFFMFLTNLAAIFIASAILFLFFGFYTYHSLLKKRQIISKYAISLGLLALISIPLIYTLSNAINREAQSSAIYNILAQSFNKGTQSQVVSWNWNGNTIMVTVDALSYIPDSTISGIGTQINQATRHQYTLNVTQIPVFSLAQNGQQSVSTALLNVLSGKPAVNSVPKETQNSNTSSSNSDLWLQQKLANLVKVFPYVSYYRIIYNQNNTQVSGISVLFNPADPVTTEQMNEVIRYLNTNDNHVVIRVFAQSTNINVPPVYFANDRYAVEPIYVQELNDLSAFLENQPQYTVTIVGHADSTGSAAINAYLSRMRAETVANTLVQQGLPAGRVKVSYAAAGQAGSGGRRVDLKLVPGQVPSGGAGG